MNRKELIEIAKRCSTGVCHPACLCYGDVTNCMEDLIKALVEELEKNTIPVGNGKDYEVVNE